MKLSANFSLEEITDIPWNKLWPPQRYMIVSIVNNIMQPIRNALGKPIRITSGLRTLDDYNRMLSKGYYPSETSDHFYGAPVPVKSPTKIALYGSTYCYSVGAIDFTTENLVSSFNLIRGMISSNAIRVGQLIHERDAVVSWIHISNHPSIIYSDYFCSTYLTKRPLLVSSDGGKTYQTPVV